MATQPTQEQGQEPQPAVDDPAGEESQPQPVEQEGEQPGGEEVDSLDLVGLRERARTAAKQHRYRGKLTIPLLRDLEPIFGVRIPEEYLLHSDKTEGKPYESTGLRSVQVQLDIANAVLGGAHWRLLTHYPDGNDHVCHAWVIFGNDLSKAKLSDDGEDVEPRGATIFVQRDGWGGVKRSNHSGDGRKGSKTNATKRAFSEAGIGSSVYRLDFDEELVEGAAPAGEPAQAQSRAQPRESSAGRSGSRGAKQPKETPETKLAALLATDDPLKDLRVEADKGMGLLNFNVVKRLGWLEQDGQDEEGLKGLIERASNALEAQTAAEEAESPA